MNKSQRIYLNTTGTTATDNFIFIQLEQNIGTIEFMSLNIDTKNAYQDFNADYGILIGRVSANGGVGIKNAKISMFIPLTDTDSQDSITHSLYPYKTPRDKNNDGKRYNLLPRVGRVNQDTGVISPKQPFGSFPIKEEIVTNQSFLEIYKKYYKYTALTNDSGDYMIFGVPVGIQIVHMSVDITDIGEYSMSPASMVTNLGYSPNLFTDNNTKIKESDDLDDLPNIETQEIAVNIIPFWGDTQNFIIGITRQDFRIRSTLMNTFVIFGSVFTDGVDSSWGANFDAESGRNINELYRISDYGGAATGNDNISIQTKRIGKVTEKIYYYPASIGDYDIDNGFVDPKTQMLLLDTSEYSTYKRDGDFCFIINCNRTKITTDEFGNKIEISPTSPNGVFTKFRGFITLQIDYDNIPLDIHNNIGKDTSLNSFRYIYKFPQYADKGHSFNKTENNKSDGTNDTNFWRLQHYTFEASQLYSVSKFHGLTYMDSHSSDDDANKFTDGFSNQDVINNPHNYDAFWNVGIIQTNDDGVSISGNSIYQMVSNAKYSSKELFGANWLNFSIHFPQVGYAHRSYHIEHWSSNDNFTDQTNKDDANSEFYYNDNLQIIAANQSNTKWFARSDLHWTDFINVPKEDIILMSNPDIKKGFTNNDITNLKGNYRNGSYIPFGWSDACPINGGKAPTSTWTRSDSADTRTFFYKGFDMANCIDYIISLGLV